MITDLYGYCINDPINAVDPWGLMSETDCSWLEPFIEGQITITNNYKDIASGTYNNSYKQFIILRRNTETIADASGYKSEAYDNMPCEVQHIVDIHESYHQWHMPFLVSSILYLFNLNSWAEFIAAEEYRAHSISNRLLNELYEKECKK